MGLEAVYFLGALVLLTALIYGTLSYRYRNRAATQAPMISASAGPASG